MTIDLRLPQSAPGLKFGAGLVVALAMGCAPSPSTVPLGLGPLAVAEQARDAEAVAHRRPPARSSRSHPEPMAQPAASVTKPAEPASDDGAEKADGEPSEPNAAAAETGFEGTYAGDDVAIYRLSGYPEREERDDKAKIRVEKASGGNVGITLINSADGSDLCELIARVEGNAALLESAQPCFSDGSEGSLEAELTSGRAVFQGNRLKMDAVGTLSVSLPDQDVDGQLSYSFEGERQ